ncbi:recombinase family protein [Faecalibacterium prausnitzii]|uniref:recombinase family protein n=1 Tax=Faecalibacterium prausnitzii TaxID=853 RepID=UPI00241DB53F|nr:recombinase family protein [Faecalibacterium prausnitzii]
MKREKSKTWRCYGYFAAWGMVEIVNFLNDKGVRNMLGGKMTHSSVNTMLKNRRYIGELSFRDIIVPEAIPAIVPKKLFDRVQKRMVPCDLITYIA